MIIETRGVLGLYQGMGISLCGIAPFIGIKMTSFDMLKDLFAPKDKKSPYMMYYNLGIGAAAGTIAVTLTYPTDLVRRLIQLNGQPGHSYNGIFDACNQLYKREGPMGFYKGLWATYLKVAPMTAILFFCNEKLKLAVL